MYENIPGIEFGSLVTDFFNDNSDISGGIKIVSGGNSTIDEHNINKILFKKNINLYICMIESILPIVLLVSICIILLWIIWRSLCKPVYWFHRDTCPHCVDMRPAWRQFEFACICSMLLPQKIDISDPINQEIVDLYDVQSVPTIIKIERNLGFKYEGNRVSDDIYNWATQSEY